MYKQIIILGIVFLFTSCVDNEKNGNKVNECYDVENVKPIIEYKNDTLNGKYKEYYDNGNIKTEKEYKHGYKDGIIKKYYKNGTLKYEMEYEMGVALSKITYDSLGNIIDEVGNCSMFDYQNAEEPIVELTNSLLCVGQWEKVKVYFKNDSINKYLRCITLTTKKGTGLEIQNTDTAGVFMIKCTKPDIVFDIGITFRTSLNNNDYGILLKKIRTSSTNCK